MGSGFQVLIIRFIYNRLSTSCLLPISAGQPTCKAHQLHASCVAECTWTSLGSIVATPLSVHLGTQHKHCQVTEESLSKVYDDWWVWFLQWAWLRTADCRGEQVEAEYLHCHCKWIEVMNMKNYDSYKYGTLYNLFVIKLYSTDSHLHMYIHKSWRIR